jgi:tetratricopeptide (TPR) repeat protein
MACYRVGYELIERKIRFSIFKMNQYDDAEEALTEANFLNNQNAGKELMEKNIEFLFEFTEVWAYLTLICLQTKRYIEAEQSYKYAIKVRISGSEINSSPSI